MISGTFNGEFQEISSNNSINITDGVFTDIIFEDNISGQAGDTLQASGGSLTVDIEGETNTFDFQKIVFRMIRI